MYINIQPEEHDGSQSDMLDNICECEQIRESDEIVRC